MVARRGTAITSFTSEVMILRSTVNPSLRPLLLSSATSIGIAVLVALLSCADFCTATGETIETVPSVSTVVEPLYFTATLSPVSSCAA